MNSMPSNEDIHKEKLKKLMTHIIGIYDVNHNLEKTIQYKHSDDISDKIIKLYKRYKNNPNTKDYNLCHFIKIKLNINQIEEQIKSLIEMTDDIFVDRKNSVFKNEDEELKILTDKEKDFLKKYGRKLRLIELMEYHINILNDPDYENNNIPEVLPMDEQNEFEKLKKLVNENWEKTENWLYANNFIKKENEIKGENNE